MFTVRCGDNLLLNKFVPGRVLGEPNLHQQANEPGRFEFTIYDSHPSYNAIGYLSSRIKIYKDGALYWLGRVKSSLEQNKRFKTYCCEGCLAFLKDSFIAPYEFNGTPAELFQNVIYEHNSHVSESQRFVVGTCNVEDPNDYIVRSSIDYDNAYNVLKKKLIDSFGGYLYITFDENERPIINYLKDAPATSTQLVEFGENLIDYEHQLFYDELYTACIPLGYKEEGESRLTIKTVNDDVEYLVNDTLAAEYGLRFAPTSLTTWDDVTQAANLKVKGQAWLQDHGVKYKDSVNLNAIDISAIKQGVSSLKFLHKAGFKLKSDIVYYVVEQLDIDLNNSAINELTLGGVKQLFTNLVADKIGGVSDTVGKIQSDYTTGSEVSNAINSASQIIENYITEQTTSIRTDINNIISTALLEYVSTSELGNFKNTLMSEIEQVANSISLSVTEQVLADSDFATGNDVDKKVGEIYSFIKVISSGVVIGTSDTDVKMKLVGDALLFYTGDDAAATKQTAIAYISSGKLYVNESHINVLTIGPEGAAEHFSIVGEGSLQCLFMSPRRM